MVERPVFARADAVVIAVILAAATVLASVIAYAAFRTSAPAASASTPSTSTPTPAPPSPTPATSFPATATIDIPHADRFDPFVVEVAAGATVTWRNLDTDAHTVAAMPTDPAEFRLVVQPGGAQDLSFPEAGVYGYYCDVHSVYDETTGLVKADKGADAYPVSMYGIILVVGPGLPIAGGRDKVVVPGADRFAPLATVVHAGTTVAWTNIDTDPHSVNAPPGAPAPLSLVVQPGKTAELTFDTPGTYTYFCAIHAAWNAQLQRAQALPGTSEYPAAMEGVVFVLP